MVSSRIVFTLASLRLDANSFPAGKIYSVSG